MLTIRLRLKFRMLGAAKKQPLKSRAAFKRSTLEMFARLTEPDLIAERNRIGERRGGTTRSISEAWIELEGDRREEEVLCKYWERVQLNERETYVLAVTGIS